jgi:AbrB family looped-hinge helix DNA binding protein
MTDGEGACRLEALVTVDERGQMVLPKDLRERLGILAGGRLAISSCGCDGEVCCLVLMRADRLDGMVRGVLGPVMREIL